MDSYFGCFTGDCPHEKQSECDVAIRKYCAELEQENTRLKEQLQEQAKMLDFYRMQIDLRNSRSND